MPRCTRGWFIAAFAQPLGLCSCWLEFLRTFDEWDADSDDSLSEEELKQARSAFSDEEPASAIWPAGTDFETQSICSF